MLPLLPKNERYEREVKSTVIPYNCNYQKKTLITLMERTK